MADNNKTLLMIGGAAAAYFLFLKPSSDGTPSASTSLLSNLFTPEAATQQNVTSTGVPIDYGVNGGYQSKDHASVSNYDVLVAAHPSLGNPNYLLTPDEKKQYIANYLDLQQGVKPGDEQKHWTMYGVAQKRIFLPLMPPSTAEYIKPVVNVKAKKGHSIWGFVLQSVTAIAGGVLEVVSAGALTPIVAPAEAALLPMEGMIKGVGPQVLSEAEVELLFTGCAVMKEILPYYRQVDNAAVTAINNKIDSVLSQYS